MVLELEQTERGTGYWKFNNTLLQKKEFVEQMNQEIESTLQASSQNSSMETWEILKNRIRKTAKSFAKKNSSTDKLIIAQLSEKINDYESRLPLTQEEDQLWAETKADLEEKTLERIQGVMFRSKAKWYEEGERNTKYFYSLEKAKYNAKTCFTLIDQNGKELKQNDEILGAQKKFYQELYEEDKDVHFNLKNTKGVYVPEGIRENQNQQITLSDLGRSSKIYEQ